MTIILGFLFLEAGALGTAVEDIIFTYNIHNFIVLAYIKGINHAHNNEDINIYHQIAM